CALAIFTAGGSTAVVLPAWLSAGRKTFGRSVATHGCFAHVTLLKSLPAYTGRVATSLSPSIENATESAEMPTPRRAACRASAARCPLVTSPQMAFGDGAAAR